MSVSCCHGTIALYVPCTYTGRVQTCLYTFMPGGQDSSCILVYTCIYLGCEDSRCWQVPHVRIVKVIMLTGTETELCSNLPCPRFNCVSCRKHGGLHYRVAGAFVALCPPSQTRSIFTGKFGSGGDSEGLHHIWILADLRCRRYTYDVVFTRCGLQCRRSRPTMS